MKLFYKQIFQNIDMEDMISEVSGKKGEETKVYSMISLIFLQPRHRKTEGQAKYTWLWHDWGEPITGFRKGIATRF